LLTSKEELGIPSLGEQRIALGSLTLENTIRLFSHLCPGIHSSAERRQLLETLLPHEDEGELLYGPNLPPHIKRLFEVLGRGIPARVENAAFCIDKEKVLPRLLNGTIRDELLSL
jgi:hypothetical protein